MDKNKKQNLTNDVEENANNRAEEAKKQAAQIRLEIEQNLKKKERRKMIVLGVMAAIMMLIAVIGFVFKTTDDNTLPNGSTTTNTTTTTTTTTTTSTTTTTKPTTTTTNNQGGSQNPSDDPVHVHTEVIDPAVDATCTSTGLTEGKHCSECGDVLIAQQETPIVAHTYDNKYDDECNVCGHKRDAECGHFETEVIPGYEATCTAAGLSDGVKCKKCGDILTEQSIIPVKAHNEVSIPEVEATCTKTGLSEGKKCSSCDKTLVAQQVTPKINHIEGDWIVDKSATATDDGERHTECIMCGEKMSEETIPATGSVGLAYTVNSDGQSCTITGIGTCADTEIIIPNQIDGYKVTDLGDKAFADCTSITFINIPNTVKTIGTRAFYGCTGLTEITIPASVTSIGTQVFYKASNLTTVYYNSTYASTDNQFINLAHIKKVVFGGSYIPSEILKGHSNITEIEIKDSVKSIGNSSFCDCTLLTRVVIGESVTGIAYRAFAGCTSLTSIEVDTNNKYFKSIGGNLYTKDGKTLVQYAIGNSATSFTLPDSVTNIGDRAFEGCKSLTIIEIPDSVTSIGDYAFYNCTSLTSVEIGDSVASIGDFAFSYCTSLRSIEIPDSVTRISQYTFSHCTFLTSITIPDSVKSIDQYAFSDCINLRSITIPDSVTNLGSGAFSGCSSLKSITIPNSVTSFGDCVFSACSSRMSITFEGTVEQWKAINKSNRWDLFMNSCTIYCTDGTMSKS